MNPDLILGIVAACVAILAGWLVFVAVVSGGDFSGYGKSRRLQRRYLKDRDFAGRVQNLLKPPPPPPPPKPSAEPLYLLTLMQREGRLLDFLLEDVQGYSDEQIGAAVRDIHRGCQKALKEHLVLKPVLNQTEGASVEVPAGFDPSAIRLTGNVTGQPPFRGTLQHHGWRAAEIKAVKPPEGQDEFVIQPAEVEL